MKFINPNLIRKTNAIVLTAVIGIDFVTSIGRLQAQTNDEPYTFTTLAGAVGDAAYSDGTNSAAQFSNPQGVAVDGSGNVYVGDRNNNAIRKITPDGTVTTLAGLGSDDGAGGQVWFNQPQGVAVDGSGNVYVADSYNNIIRIITAAGVVTTLAGSDDPVDGLGSADGTGSAAQFNTPTGVAVDGSGNVYVADQGNNTIRKITSTGVVTTLAGLAGTSGTNDDIGSAARFGSIQNLAVDSSGYVYVADGNNAIRKITPAGVVTTLAGSLGNPGSNDGTGSVARFGAPQGVAVDASGNVYVADTSNNTIRKITPAGAVTTLAGLAGAAGSDDGTGSSARFNFPVAVAADGSGKLYVADSSNDTIRAGVPVTASCLTITFNSATLPDGNLGIRYDQTNAGTWTATGALNTGPRSQHTATLLPNGKVLVAGGEQNGRLTSAELYDPATGLWAVTGPLNHSRGRHTATLLPNGKVLVAGGHDGAGALSTAELYDPAAGTWTTTGAMTTNHSDHTATLLPNGKVLVAGGGAGSSGNVAELYDPATGTWVATGSMNYGRNHHTATLLPNGQVLVADGDNVDATHSAELYDPTTGTWTLTGSTVYDGGSKTATLLPNGQVLLAGYRELYDPATGTWTATSPMSFPRYNHAAALLPNGQVLIAGGQSGSESYRLTSELYDPTTDRWIKTGSQSTARENLTMTLLPDGRVLAAGGGNNGSSSFPSTGIAELYTAAGAANGGVPPYTYALTSGTLPGGLALVSDGSLAGIPFAIGTNTFTVTATDAKGCNGSQTYTLNITGSGNVLDTNKPTVTIVSPFNKTTVTTPTITITGTAKDATKTPNTGVAEVLYSCNGGALQLANTANNFANWTAGVTLVPGPNTFVVESLDYRGNVSTIIINSYFYKVLSPLTVVVSGPGSVLTPDGTNLVLTTSHTITAIPGANALFLYWSNSITGDISATSNYKFTMQTNLAVTAVFIHNPFVEEGGIYNGLFYEDGGATFNRSGYFTFTVTSTRSFTGKIAFGGESYALNGAFSLAQPQTQVTIARPDKPSLVVTMQLLATNGSYQVTGSVTDGTWTATLLGDQAYYKKGNIAPQAGNYTMTLFSDSNGDLSPSNGSSGTGIVGTNGAITLSGLLSDGSSISQSSYISKDGHWPLYVPLYQAKVIYTNGLVYTNTVPKGSLLGWLTFTNTLNDKLTGNASWIKSTDFGGVAVPFGTWYTNGFTNVLTVYGGGRHP